MMKSLFSSAFLLLFSLASTSVFALSNVKLSNVHLCCSTCQEAVEFAVGQVKGANVKVDRDAKTIAVSASNDQIAQQALDAIANAGFYGKSDHAEINLNTANVQGNASQIELLGFHNCCGSCESAIKSALNAVSGVTQVGITKRSCKVTGNFDTPAVLKALNAAGFSSNIKE